jgi:hypothetical protein
MQDVSHQYFARFNLGKGAWSTSYHGWALVVQRKSNLAKKACLGSKQGNYDVGEVGLLEDFRQETSDCVDAIFG